MTLAADVQHLVDQAVEQGFPEKCSDPLTMAKIATALAGASTQAPRRKPRARKVA